MKRRKWLERAVGFELDADRGRDSSKVSIPEIRDYQRINAELVQKLDAGHRRVSLMGAEGQRLLASGLTGGWEAVIEVQGHAGPELAAGLNAPGVRVVCFGSAADGAGQGLAAGMLIVRGDVGVAGGYAQRGGSIIVVGDAGARVGLEQSGGSLILLGEVGQLAGERQSGGYLFAIEGRVGAYRSRGGRGGEFVVVSRRGEVGEVGQVGAKRLLGDVLKRAEPWLIF